MKITVDVIQTLATRKPKEPHKRNLGLLKYQQTNNDAPLLFISSNSASSFELKLRIPPWGNKSKLSHSRLRLPDKECTHLDSKCMCVDLRQVSQVLVLHQHLLCKVHKTRPVTDYTFSR